MNIAPIRILMVEDNDGDVFLTTEALKSAKVANELFVVHDGVECMDFLRQKGKYADALRPDLILLDLNLPRRDGREVLAELKPDPDLRKIPVVVLTSSSAEIDVAQAYDLHANCYIVKPVDFANLLSVVRAIENFWLNVVRLPPNGS
jgi:two-component system, chemotaxis family, response regulator Rcp1